MAADFSVAADGVPWDADTVDGRTPVRDPDKDDSEPVSDDSEKLACNEVGSLIGSHYVN